MNNYISYEKIEKEANKFLNDYNPNRDIPVPIEEIVEIKLEISIVPKMGMLSRHGIDAFLSYDFTELYIDYDHYIQPRERRKLLKSYNL